MEQGYGAASYDENPDGKYSLQFSQQSVRAGFVRKVFMLVTLMFTFVAGLCVIPIASPDFRNWVFQNFWIYIIAIVVFLVVSIALSCCSGLRRTFPTNIILLTVFTIAAGVMTTHTLRQNILKVYLK